MNKEAQHSIQYVMQNIMDSVWNGVSKQTIAKRLSLAAARLQTFQLMASYIQNATQNKNQRNPPLAQIDPKPIPMDSFACNQITKQVRQSPIKNNKKSVKQSQASIINESRLRKFQVESISSKNQKSKNNNSRVISQNGGLITLPSVEDPHYVKDVEEDKCRTYIFRIQKEEKQTKALVQQRTKQRSQNSMKNKKIIKDLKKFTYDYEGKFFGTGAKDHGQQKMLKIDKNYGQPSLLNKSIKNPEQKNIINEKMKQKQSKGSKSLTGDEKNEPKFNQNRPESILDLFQQDSKISEGVKLISINGKQQLIKQNPRRKLSGAKQYHLSQYQNMNKNKKFINFKRNSANYSSATIDQGQNYAQNKAQQLKSFRNIDSSSLKHQQVKQQSELPPINGLKMKKSKIMAKYSQSSNSILNESSISSKISSRSFVRIDHQQLFNENFPHFYEIN